MWTFYPLFIPQKTIIVDGSIWFPVMLWESLSTYQKIWYWLVDQWEAYSHVFAYASTYTEGKWLSSATGDHNVQHSTVTVWCLWWCFSPERVKPTVQFLRFWKRNHQRVLRLWHFIVSPDCRDSISWRLSPVVPDCQHVWLCTRCLLN